MGQADALITSPPYADNGKRDRTGGARDARRGRRQGRGCFKTSECYGTSAGQLGALKSGPCPGGEAVVGDDVETLTWTNCYGTQWGPLLCPAAMSHPAKFSYNLLARLYDHGFARGWWQKHSLICDPFGGVGCGGVVAAYRGLRWIGCELEPRFISLAEETFALHRGKWAAAGDTPPVIVQGDSRQFAALVAGAAGVVTSPPYADTATIASGVQRNEAGWGASKDLSAGKSKDYGTTPGQLGALKPGHADSVVTSPPYVSGGHHADQTGAWGGCAGEAQGHTKDVAGYGQTRGQVGRLKEGDADGVVTSPPYAASVHGRNGIDLAKCDRPGPHTQAGARGYGEAPGNVGNLRSGPLAFCAACGRMIPDTQRPRSDHVDPTEPETGGPGDAMSQSAALGIPSSGAACAETARGDDLGVDRRVLRGRGEHPLAGGQAGDPAGQGLPFADRTEGQETTGSGPGVPEGSGHRQPHSLPSAGEPEVSAVVSNLDSCHVEARRHDKDSDRTDSVPDPKAGRRRKGAGPAGRRQKEPQDNRRGKDTPVARPGADLAGSCGQDGMPLAQSVQGCPACGLPYGENEGSSGLGSGGSAEAARTHLLPDSGSDGLQERHGQGTSPAGEEKAPETYWTACRKIYLECFKVLKPSGVMAVVIKDYVRARQRVPLCDQTWRLLLSLGFTPVERIRCLLSEETREPSLFGGDCVRRTERASFFRRLATKKGAPAIDFEEVLVVRKPYNGGVAPRDALTSGGRAEPLSEVQP